MKRSIRVIALLLAVLLVVLPPMQAQAAIGTGTAMMIGLGAAAVIGSVMAGLGVMPGSDRSVFDGLVNDCIASDAVSPFLDGDGLIQVLRYTNGIGNVRYGVLRNLIEAVRGWIWKNSVISSPITFASEYTYTYWGGTNSISTTSPSVPICVVQPSGAVAIFILSKNGHGTMYCNGTQVRNDSSNWRSLDNGYLCYWYGSISSYDVSKLQGLNIFYVDTVYDLGSMDFESIFSAYDVSVGDIVASSDDLTSSYSNWSSGSIALPHPGIDIPGVDEGTDEGTGEDTGEEEGEEEGEKKLVYWPTGIGGSLTDIGSDATTGALTQEGVISGVGTLDDTLTGALPGTIVGGITGDIAIDDTQTGEGTDEGTGEGEITYPTDIPSYTLDLTDIFPFCIPFDIYEFLSILAAEPEAPVFHWKVPVPQLGTEYEVEVDLSPWDNVAKLFRTLELLAFIVGLAMMTRDKFIRS